MNVYFLVALGAAVAIGVVARASGFRLVESLGLGLVAWPFARLAVNVGANWGRLFEFTVLETIPEAALWRSAGRTLWHSFVIPLVGLALLTGGFGSASRVSRLAPRRSIRLDLLDGFALVIPVLAGYLLAYAVLVSGAADRLVNGDESAAFAAMTPLLAVAVSVAAGVAEEFLYRGVLLAGLLRFAPPAAALLLQAGIFGIAHAGYGTWAHVLGPAIFGLFMGAIALRLGLWPAIVLHAAINVAFFSIDMLPREPAAWALLLALVASSLAALAVVRLAPVRELLRRPAMRAGGSAP